MAAAKGSEPEQAQARSGGIKDKQVFTRVDLAVPQVRQDPNSIMNTALIDAVLPTIEYALEDGVKSVALCSHLGRPIGKKTE